MRRKKRRKEEQGRERRGQREAKGRKRKKRCLAGTKGVRDGRGRRRRTGGVIGEGTSSGRTGMNWKSIRIRGMKSIRSEGGSLGKPGKGANERRR